MSQAPLLVELCTEELPPHAVRALGDAFAASIVQKLGAHGLMTDDGRWQAFASPRHLAVLIDAVQTEGTSQRVSVKGPSLKAGHDANGQPTTALVKWAERQGVALSDLRQEGDGKQAHFAADKTVAGAVLAEVIDGILEQTIAALPVPKLMRYQLADGYRTVSFARPAHHLIVLHGSDVVPASALGLVAGRSTRGHRFLSHGLIDIPSAADYPQVMHDARVVVSFDARRDLIVAALARAAADEQRRIGDDASVTALIEEVAALVEWPVVYCGGFDARYLQVPAECLILTMQTNQRYFPLFDADGSLSNRFLIVSNMAVNDPSRIIAGNERVVVPRLADAEFFYAQDRRHSLASRVPRLASVVYHAKLGSQAERSQRVGRLAVAMAGMLELGNDDIGYCARAAALAKTDLLTDMVGEFPELQGIMGEYYARHDGEDEAVARAMREQYQPRFAGDALPASPVGTVLALADKLETVAGMFSIGQFPTGDRDPFALRRHALGIIRMLIEKSLPLALADLLAACRQVFTLDDDASVKLTAFVHERLVGYLRDRGHQAAEIQAVIAVGPERLAEIPARLTAVSEFSRLPQAQSLAAANKRIGNILRKSAPADLQPDAQPIAPDPSLYEEPAEHELASAVDALATPVADAMQAGRYTDAMLAMAKVRDPVDRFFDQVMVMAEDEAQRVNRLRLLARVHAMMNRVADISGLANT